MTTPPSTPVLALNAQGKRDWRGVVASLESLPGLKRTDLGPFHHGEERFYLPRFEFNGPRSEDPIPVGIFGGIHGDEPAGALAVAAFLHRLAAEPALAENYQIVAYPLCNPSGFADGTRHSRAGVDLNREFWQASDQPEVRLLEAELWGRHFQGIVQLHADDTSDGVYGYVRGATLTESLLRPALQAAERVLPRNSRPLIDGFAARDGIIYDGYRGILAAPEELRPVPFEIVLETPAQADSAAQVEAFCAALGSILREYRDLVSFAQNI